MAHSLVRSTLGAGPAGAMPAWPGRLKRWAARRMSIDGLPIRFILYDGTSLYEPAVTPVAAIRLCDRGTFLRLLLDPENAFADGYASGRLEVEGDLTLLLEKVYRLGRQRGRWRTRRWTRLVAGRGSARREVRYHYDRGNDFYQLWLDQEMVYTCGYFPHPHATLEQAQLAKMDRVCRKLHLQAGERVVEAGCGWGALAIHMARAHGVTVRAYNLSHEQVCFARERSAREGLGDRVEFIEDDYRNITGTYDAFVSVGMLEHVGARNYDALGSVMQRVLREDGRGLLHFIGRNYPRPLSRWIRRHIFPGAYPPTLDEACRGVLQPWNFSVLDVENLRLHYALTLRHWRERFERHEDTVRQRYGDRFVRTWRMYLAGSEAAFTTGWLQLFQVLFARGDTNHVPWTRESVR